MIGNCGYVNASIKKFYLTKWTSNVIPLYSSNNVISSYQGIVDPWYEIVLDTATITYSQEANTSMPSGMYYTEKITVNIPKAENSKWKELVEILSDDYITIFTDANDNTFTAGYKRGCKVSSYSLSENQYIIEFTTSNSNNLPTSTSISITNPTDLLGNCHFDLTRTSKLYLGSCLFLSGDPIVFPLGYQTVAGTSDSKIAYHLWSKSHVIQIGCQYIQFSEVLSDDTNITFTENLTIDQKSRNYEKTITFELNGIGQTLVDQLETLGLNDDGFRNPPKTLAILVDENDQKLIVGYDFPLTLDIVNSGINEESNNMVLTYTSRSGSRARDIDYQPMVYYNGCFNSGSGTTEGFNTRQNVVKVEADGNILVGTASGTTLTYGGVSVTDLVRLSPNGSLANIFPDFTVGGGGLLNISTLYVESDGKIVIGGYFSSYSGISTSSIIRIFPNGELDTTFHSYELTGFNAINHIDKQSDGKYLLGGMFDENTYSGVTVGKGVARLDVNGYLDPTFQSGVGLWKASIPELARLLWIEEMPDGKILCIGTFEKYSGVTASNLILLNSDGSVASTLGGGMNFAGTTCTYNQYDDKIYIGTFASLFSGQTVAQGMIRLNSDYSLDDTFDIGTGSGGGGSAISFVFEPDGRIFCGGAFTSWDGQTISKVIRLNNDGSVDETFVSGAGFNNHVVSVAHLIDDSTIGCPNQPYVMVGWFTEYSGVTANYIQVVNFDGSTIDCPGPLPSPTPSVTPSISMSMTPTPSTSSTPSASVTPTISNSSTPSASVTPSISVTPTISNTPSASNPHLVYLSYAIYGTGSNLSVIDKDSNLLLDEISGSGSISISESVLPYSVIGACISGSGNIVRFHVCNTTDGTEQFTSEDNYPSGISIGNEDTYLASPTPVSVSVEVRANNTLLSTCPVP